MLLQELNYALFDLRLNEVMIPMVGSFDQEQARLVAMGHQRIVERAACMIIDKLVGHAVEHQEGRATRPDQFKQVRKGIDDFGSQHGPAARGLGGIYMGIYRGIE